MKSLAWLGLCLAVSGCATGARTDVPVQPVLKAAPTTSEPDIAPPMDRRAATCHADVPAPKVFSAGQALFDAPMAGELLSQVEVQGSQVTVPIEQLNSKKRLPLDPAAVQADVMQLWKLGVFEDVRAEVKKTAGGVVLTYVLTDKPRIGNIYLDGAEHLTEDEVRHDASDSGLDGLFDRDKLDQAVREVREKLEVNGYRFAQLEARTRRFDASTMDVCLQVKEGPRVTIDRWTFVGNHNIGTADLLKSMRTEDGKYNVVGGTYHKELAEYNILVINALYYDRGMLEVRVSSPVLTMGSDKTSLSVEVTIEEGPIYRIGRMQIVRDGKRTFAYDRLVRQKKGQVFNRSMIAEDIQHLQTALKEKDGLNVDVVPETELNKVKGIVDVKLKIEAK